MNVLFLVLSGVSLLVSAIGIANVTLVRVMERTGEIGLRRALGAAQRHIAYQFLLESAAMGLGSVQAAGAGRALRLGGVTSWRGPEPADDDHPAAARCGWSRQSCSPIDTGGTMMRGLRSHKIAGCHHDSQEVPAVYMQRITIYSDPEKVAEIRALLIERAKARQAAGMRLALTEMVAGGHAPQFTVNILFNDLAAFEASRKRDQADGDFQKFVAKLTSLTRKPNDFDLLEVLLPMPN